MFVEVKIDALSSKIERELLKFRLMSTKRARNQVIQTISLEVECEQGREIVNERDP
jgi:hypothetical protein